VNNLSPKAKATIACVVVIVAGLYLGLTGDGWVWNDIPLNWIGWGFLGCGVVGLVLQNRNRSET
jgi:hypothetical protein